MFSLMCNVDSIQIEALSYIHIHLCMQNMVLGVGLLKIKIGGKEYVCIMKFITSE
jgi:hypothetical protein